MNRRNFLQLSASSIALATTGGLTSLLGSTQALAASNDYKALVCVFLYGGMDNYDTVIPYDNTNYQRWAQARSGMLAEYETARSLANLLPLNTAAGANGQQFALPPEMPGLQQLFNNGNAAIVGNVGPLVAPTTASDFQSGAVALPSRLFSHNDQQSTWMSGTTEGAQFGWGGRMLDNLASTNVSNNNTFSAITMSSGELLITGPSTKPYNLVGGKALSIAALDASQHNRPNPEETYLGTNTSYVNGLPQDLSNFFSESKNYNNVLRQDIANETSSAYQKNQQFNNASTQATGSSFPPSYLGNQLSSVFKVINARQSLGPDRQVFVVTLGGFDTHSGQPVALPSLQRQIDGALSAFYNELASAGLENQVTLFTASDFGRTLAFNGDGTDHGWGAHHFVVGGAVNGGQIYGNIPDPVLGHDLDAGAGRLIPSTSMDQYAATLAAWMGVQENQLTSIFPNLSNFNGRPNFMG
ncbi:hypothetical protein CHH28_00875 [Bacterioplanes sanyensis]|uniref:Tat pathway signal protein n=1 Tax=Bacterioplanes sanyensis TaxID=1249553 RepID=A0A222FFB3_9GAMM|nr:DUF1501 domain-containing protein [Bacterioplanes sanyensis]ASP37322.1 hypothetical protein CHH28_00875 [Bacterioplanes sanyensis]